MAFCSTLMVLSIFASLPEPFSNFSTSETNFHSIINRKKFSCSAGSASSRFRPSRRILHGSPGHLAKSSVESLPGSPISRVAPRMVSLMLPKFLCKASNLSKGKADADCSKCFSCKAFYFADGVFCSSTEFLSTLNRIRLTNFPITVSFAATYVSPLLSSWLLAYSMSRCIIIRS